MSRLLFLNRQRVRRLEIPLLRQVTRFLLQEQLQIGAFHLCFHLVGPRTMAGVNVGFLGHDGATDVITFDYSDGSGPLSGEVFICLSEAVGQARRFRTTWTAELVRYVVHAVLHLVGEDDRMAPARRRMKRREDLLVRQLARRFPLSRLEKRPRVRP